MSLIITMLKEQYVVLRKRNIFFDLIFYPKPNYINTLCFHDWIKLTLKDHTFMLFMCGGPCHVSSFTQCSGDLTFLWEQLVYSVMEKFASWPHYYCDYYNYLFVFLCWGWWAHVTRAHATTDHTAVVTQPQRLRFLLMARKLDTCHTLTQLE